MAYKFKAIEKDKESYKSDNTKTLQANSAFGSYEIGQTDQHITENIKIEDLPKIQLSDIKEREVNNFDKIKNDTLKASILEVGLINPISVRKDGLYYRIISGHRRYEAYNSILNDLRERRKSGENTPELNRQIKFYSEIPAMVYEIVEEGSTLLGTDKRYITSDQEEKIYEASNLENRQISRKDLTEHIIYFYKMVKENQEFRKTLLEQRNKDGIRKAKKLNVPKVLSSIITQDLGFSVAPSYIWSLVTLIENKDKYPEYHEVVMNRIKAGEKVKTAYNDYEMAVKIHDNTHDNTHSKEEALQRIMAGKEPVKAIYNEYFGIEEKPRRKMPVSTKERAAITKLFSSAQDLNALYSVMKKLGYLDEIPAYES